MKQQWRMFMFGWAIILIGSLIAHFVQTTGGITIKDIRFSGANGNTLSAYLYIPEGVTADNPAPGILAVHGYINSKEVQSGFAIEFARRGYVVLSMDQAGHGYSDAPAFAAGFGGPAGLAYLRTLDIVDNNNIGLEGHSMGGWTILAAAAAHPEDYKSMVLEGSSVGGGRSAPGSTQWPRNVAVVFSQYDEFAASMWQVPKGSDVGSSANLKTLFGSNATVNVGELHGDIANGTARILFSPPVTHPGDHISHVAIGHAIEWFDRTLDGGNALALPANDQIWFMKELGTLTALIGFVVLVCGSFSGLLSLPVFSGLQKTPDSFAYEQRTPRWWVVLILSALIPVLSFYPFMTWGGQLFGPSALLPQSVTSQVAFWGVMNGILFTLMGKVIKAQAMSFSTTWIPTVGISLSVIGIAYCAVLLADFLFLIDFRFWFVGIKAMNLMQLQIMLVYLLPFTVFFLLALRALHAGLSVRGDSTARLYTSNILALMGGFLLFLILQYAKLFLNGSLITPSEPLNTIVMLQFVPLLTIVGIFTSYTYSRTASYVPGALICALFVSWYVVAGQATQFPVN